MKALVNVGKSIKESPTVIILFLVAVAGFIVSCCLTYEDYSSSYIGYSSLPTRKANEWIPIVAALVPQLGQIIFGYSFIAGGRPFWKALVLFMLHVADTGTDIFFKAAGQGIGVWVLAFAESEVLFTLGSEVLLTLSFSMIIDLFPSFISQSAKLISDITDALGGLKGDGDDDVEPPSPHFSPSPMRREPSSPMPVPPPSFPKSTGTPAMGREYRQRNIPELGPNDEPLEPLPDGFRPLNGRS